MASLRAYEDVRSTAAKSGLRAVPPLSYSCACVVRSAGAARTPGGNHEWPNPLCRGLRAVRAAGDARPGGLAEDAFGVWRHPENGSHVKIYQCGSGLCAQIVKLKNPGEKDVNNPDPSKRNRPVQGIIIMSGAKKTGPDSWKGSLYNRLDGGTYSGNIKVMSKNQLRLEGCGLGGLVCKGVTWTRVK